jgi:hypothetical protein
MEKFQLGNTGLDPLIRNANDTNIARFGHLNKIVNEINSSGTASGSWTPVVDVNGFDSASAYTAYFIKVGNAIHISIWIAIENTSLSDDGIVTISLPEGYVLAAATLGNDSFQGHYVSNYPKTEYPSISRPAIAGVGYGGGLSAVQMQLFTDASPLASYEGFISGIGILAS